jgi:hypothetical protein
VSDKLSAELPPLPAEMHGTVPCPLCQPNGVNGTLSTWESRDITYDPTTKEMVFHHMQCNVCDAKLSLNVTVKSPFAERLEAQYHSASVPDVHAIPLSTE